MHHDRPFRVPGHVGLMSRIAAKCYIDPMDVMANLTIAIDAGILEAAQLEAERRNTSLDQMFADYVASVAHESARAEARTNAEREENRRQLLELMYSSPLGDLGKLPTRDEIYAERMRWPHS